MFFIASLFSLISVESLHNTLTIMKIQILTEECPQPAILKFIISHITQQTDFDIQVSCSAAGSLSMRTSCNTEVSLDIFKGTTSSVDYIVYVDDEPEPCLLIEATKTTDLESRNTSAYQRLIKFIIAKQYFPNTKLVMFYESALPKTITKTMQFGIRLLKTLGVVIIGHDGTLAFPMYDPYTRIEDIMHDKNNMKALSNNVGIRIMKTDDNNYNITAKLEKSGAFAHDPNKGLVSALCYCISKLSSNCTITVSGHGLKQSMLKNYKGNKFFFAITGINVVLQGITLPKNVARPEHYWHKQDVSSEKHASISCHFTYLNYGWQCIFHNHAGGARSYLELDGGKQTQVPKSFKIPDIVFKKDNELLLVEAKNLKTLTKGDSQLNTLQEFEAWLQDKYPSHTIRKGLCVALDSRQDTPETKHDIVHVCRFN